MNFLFLKYFCDAVRLGGITAASKVNFVTQSAISQGIAKLEGELGCHLLAHHPNQFRLTSEGEFAFRKLIELLKHAAEFKESFLGECQKVGGPLEFASTFSFSVTLIPKHLKHFHQKYPESKINFLSSGDLNEIKKMLHIGTIDFGLIPDIGNFDFTGLEKRIIYEGVQGFFISKHISAKEVKQLEFIVPKKSAATFKQIYYGKYRKEPSIFLEVQSWLIAVHSTIEGLGVGYFPDFLARHYKSQLRPYTVKLQLPKYQVCAIYPKGMSLRRSSELFLSSFKIDDESNTS